MLATAAVGLWQTDAGAAHLVGVSAMSALAGALALGLQVRSVHKAAGQWSVRPWRSNRLRKPGNTWISVELRRKERETACDAAASHPRKSSVAAVQRR